jgi:hypothetical protein
MLMAALGKFRLPFMTTMMLVPEEEVGTAGVLTM